MIADAGDGVAKDVMLTKSWPGSSMKDGVYSSGKAAHETGKAGPSTKSSTITFAGGGITELKLLRRFVYGMDYINEVVAQIVPATYNDGGAEASPEAVRYILQDANYNVVGIARACDGAMIRQFRYGPYGELTGIDALQSDGTTLAALDADTPIDAWHLFQGMFYDEEFGSTHLDGAYYANARIYRPDLGREGFRQNWREFSENSTRMLHTVDKISTLTFLHESLQESE